MSDLDAVATALRDRLGLSVADLRPLANGDINDTFRADLADGSSIFVKTSPSALSGAFSDEAAGLEWLGRPRGEIATPAVIGVVDGPAAEIADGTRLLALEWIERGHLDADGEERLGRGLATIHAAGAPAFGATPTLAVDGKLDINRFGHSPMRFNELQLPNEPCQTWAEFYAERRVRPLARACFDLGELSSDDIAMVDRLCLRLPELAGPPEPPARIHGDLWAGNVMASVDGVVYLVDPVAHGGHRELDLALLKIFGGPGARCFDAYHEAFPLAPGHADRERLWQLAMILLHVYLFGTSYRAQAISIAGHYL